MRLSTERLLLRDFEEGDWEATYAHESVPEVVRYMAFDVATPEQARENIRRRRAYADEVPRRNYELAVVLRAEDRLIGRCGVGVTDFARREATIWYVIDPRFHGRGYAAEAARWVVDWAFGELGMHRVFGDCDPRNPASARVMEKLGMRREAHFVENVFLKGEWCDTVIYAVLDREWKLAAGTPDLGT